MPSNNVSEWDEFYRTQSVAVHPDLFVVRRFSKEPPLPPRRVLILAAGAGRNAIWLAKRGFYVTAVDQSKEAIEKIEWWAKTEGIKERVDTLQLDLLAGREEYEKYLETHDYDFIIFEGCLEYFTVEQVREVLSYTRGSMTLHGTRFFVFGRGLEHWAHDSVKRSDGWMKTYPRDPTEYIEMMRGVLGLEKFYCTEELSTRFTYEHGEKSYDFGTVDDFYLEGWK